MHLIATLAALSAVAHYGNCQLQKVNDFSGSPTKLGMYAYIPKTLTKPAPVIVAVHHCQGSASGYSSESQLMPKADKYGIILVFPNSKSGGGCFDVASDASMYYLMLSASQGTPSAITYDDAVLTKLGTALKHNGGGDSQTIANMAKYAVEKLGGDANRTFAVGTSSGAMMANVLAGAYPDVFKAASVYSGVPDGCFAVAGSTATQDPPGWSNNCANGQLTKTAAQWGDMVRSYYSGYTGSRTRMQIFHGTADSTLRYPNYAEQLKQWSNVLGLTTSKDTSNSPQSGYTQTIYGEGTAATAQLVGYSAQGVGHTVPQHPDMDIAFFGLA